MTPQIGASAARESDTVSMGPIIGLGAREVCVFIVLFLPLTLHLRLPLPPLGQTCGFFFSPI